MFKNQHYALLVILIIATSPSYSQLPAAKRILQRKAEEKAEEILNGKNKKPQEKKDDAESSTNEQNEAIEEPDEVKKETPTLKTYSRYDFVPGEKVVFYEDFSQDNIGEFPLAWNTNGTAEVVTTNLYPGKWLKFTGFTTNVWIDKLIALPENSTIEFDIIPIDGEDGRMEGYEFRIFESENDQDIMGSEPGKAGIVVECEYYGRVSYASYTHMPNYDNIRASATKDGEGNLQIKDRLYHMAISIQKSRVRIYQNETKFFDLPKALPLATTRINRLLFCQGTALVGNIRIAAGSPDTRSKLLTEGKLVSYGIYFDVAKDAVKPESYGTLKSVADVLKENPTLKIKIVGHTDADGNNASNMELSKKRALNVKSELMNSFSIDGSRIETDGKGSTEPVADNDTPSNKALNRRVEFIKL